MSHSITIYFRADCSRALRGRNLGVIYVNSPKLRGFFRLEKTGQGGFLVIFTVGDIHGPDARNAANDMSVERAVRYVRDAVGEPDLAVDVQDVASWVAVSRAAERYGEGRVFIAGDAAHHMPPTGGFNGNTGVQDAHNLAWKLACVVRGEAGPALLETYDAERRPAGEQAMEQAYQRYVTRSDPISAWKASRSPSTTCTSSTTAIARARWFTIRPIATMAWPTSIPAVRSHCPERARRTSSCAATTSSSPRWTSTAAAS